MSSRPLRARRRGFTLIEMVVVLVLMSLLAGAAAPLAVGQIRGQRIRATTERMHNVVIGMVGDPTLGGHGYLGDLGALPELLEDLNQASGMPPYSVDSNDGVGAGYNGPYVPQIGGSSAPFVDAWGTPLRYEQGIAQIASAGADRVMGTSDDLVHPVVAPITTGNLTVTVTGVPNDSGTPCLLGEDDADVFVVVSEAGERQEIQLEGPIGTGGPFVRSDLHKGLHGLRFEGEGAFQSASARDVVELRGGSTHLRATLIQPSGEPPACGASGGGGGGGGAPEPEAAPAPGESEVPPETGRGGRGRNDEDRTERGNRRNEREEGRGRGRGRRGALLVPGATRGAGALPAARA